jgi:hypothetical protein
LCLIAQKNTMDNLKSVTEKTQPNAVESTEKPEMLTAVCSTMKEEIQAEAHRLFPDLQDNATKPQTLTEVCSTMKAEIQTEAHRLFPDPDTKHQRTIERTSVKN